MEYDLTRRVVAEAVGTAMLSMAVVGSGIMGETLAGGNVALALLANTIATGAALVALILTFGGISGAHFNPAVTIADAMRGGSWREVPLYIAAQVGAAFLGVASAHLMFDKPLFSSSQHVRAGSSQLFSEFVATFGLLTVLWGCVRLRSEAVPFAVAAYITAAYWFTASTSFANPAVTLARTASDTFAGIRPIDAPGFIVAQLLGATSATFLFRWLVPPPPKDANATIVPQAKGQTAMSEKRVLILCTGNSARSQMAEGILRHDGEGKFVVESAGVKSETVRPEAIEAMKEIGIDISRHRSKSVDEFAGQDFDYVITVCDSAAEHCPVFSGKTTRIHQAFEDPPPATVSDEASRLAIFRHVRDEIRAWMNGFIHYGFNTPSACCGFTIGE